MKRLFSFVVLFAMILSLSACGGAASAAAQKVEESIASIGEVSETSGAELEEARNAYNALSEKDREQVKNLDVLIEAEERYSRIQEQLQEQIREENEIKKVEELIAKVSKRLSGEADGDLDRLAEEARAAYDALTEAQQSQVTNYAALQEAELPQPFAVERGLQFEIPDRILTPISSRYSPEDKSSAEDSVYNSTVALPVPDVTRSEPDEDDYVVYTIKVSSEIRQGIEHDKYPYDGVWGWFCFSISPYGIYDYYTGRYLGRSEDVATCPTDGEKIYRSTVTFRDKTYDITYKDSANLKRERMYEAPFFEDRVVSTMFYDAIVVEYNYDDTITIRVPKDYDGLILAVRGTDEPVPEYEDMENYDCEKHSFTVEEPPVRYWEGNPDKWVFVRVDDLL